MGIDVADAQTKQAFVRYETHHFMILCYHRFGQIVQVAEDDLALLQATHRQFADNQRVRKNFSPLQQPLECGIVPAKVIDPYRGINQYHRAARRRGATVNSGSLPPSLASRRALSRSISAFNASRSSADRSLIPVKVVAFATRASSKATVVRMHQI